MKDGRGDPAGILDEIRAHPEWGDAERMRLLDALIAGYSPEELSHAIGPRLYDLAAPDGETVICLVEALATPSMLDALADALVDQPDLALERQWIAFETLEGTGRVEARPILALRRDELDELVEEADPLIELLDVLDEEPDAIEATAMYLEGEAEPDYRRTVMAELTERLTRPGSVALLMRLSESPDRDLRLQSRKALESLPN